MRSYGSLTIHPDKEVGAFFRNRGLNDRKQKEDSKL